jgi:hypothetical protein
MTTTYAVSLTAEQWAAIESALLVAAQDALRTAVNKEHAHFYHAAAEARREHLRLTALHTTLRAAVDAANPVKEPPQPTSMNELFEKLGRAAFTAVEVK